MGKLKQAYAIKVGDRVLHKSVLFSGPTMVVIRQLKTKKKQFVVRWHCQDFHIFTEARLYEFELSKVIDRNET